MSIKVMNACWERYPAANAGEMLLAIALADHCDDDGLNIYPSVESLAKKTRQGRRTVQGQLRKMVDSGWLVLVASEGGGRGKAREYRINPAWLKGADIAPFGDEKGAASAPFESGKGADSAPFNGSSDGQTDDNGGKGANPAPFNGVKGADFAPIGKINRANFAPFGGKKGAASAPFIFKRVQDLHKRVQITAQKGADSAPKPSGTIKNPSSTTSSPASALKFAMHTGWIPDENFFDQLTMAGIEHRFHDIGALGEFKSHWMTEPDRKYTHAKWQHKYLQNLQLRRQTHGDTSRKAYGRGGSSSGLSAADRSRQAIEQRRQSGNHR